MPNFLPIKSFCAKFYKDSGCSVMSVQNINVNRRVYIYQRDIYKSEPVTWTDRDS